MSYYLSIEKLAQVMHEARRENMGVNNILKPWDETIESSKEVMRERAAIILRDYRVYPRSKKSKEKKE